VSGRKIVPIPVDFHSGMQESRAFQEGRGWEGQRVGFQRAHRIKRPRARRSDFMRDFSIIGKNTRRLTHGDSTKEKTENHLR